MSNCKEGWDEAVYLFDHLKSAVLNNLRFPFAVNGIELDAVLSINNGSIQFGAELFVMASALMIVSSIVRRDRFTIVSGAIAPVFSSSRWTAASQLMLMVVVVLLVLLIRSREKSRCRTTSTGSSSWTGKRPRNVDLTGGYVTLLVIGSRRADGTATRTTLDDGRETSSVFLIEVGVQDGIDARIGCTQPLGNRCGVSQENGLRRIHLFASQFNPDEDSVKW